MDPRPRLFGGLLSAFALGACLAGCASAVRVGPQLEAAGSAPHRPWLKVGESRMRARQDATLEARRKMWASIMEMDAGPGLTMGELVHMEPGFASRLRGLVGLAPTEPAKILSDGTVVIQVRLEIAKVRRLAREYAGRVPRGGL